MRRRLLAAVLGGVLLPAGLTGCGIPDSSGVQMDGQGPAVESGPYAGAAAQPPTRTASDDPKQFVLNYLAAAAGERDGAYERVKQFIAPEARSRVREKQGSEVTLHVVRLRENPEDTANSDGTSDVRVKVQQVGVLRADGTLAPPVLTETQYLFKLRPADTGDPGLLLTTPQNVLLLSEDALQYYYGTHTIYFWNSDQTRLVPDQRYLPVVVPAERRVTEIVRWLAGGPPDWLAPGVTRLPDSTSLINNATGSDDGRWEINLNMPGANDKRLTRLATQLAWSLPEFAKQLDLKIGNQSRRTVDLEQERLTNPAYPTSGSPQRFCVYDGAIHALSFAGEPRGSVPLAAAANKAVVSAALSRAGDGILAALVVTRADRKQRLVVGHGPQPVSKPKGEGWYGSIGRPTWLRSTDPRQPYGLVVADGRLYRFDGDGGMSQVSLAVSGTVSAVAASLDGHRIALIVDGALYVAAVSLDGGVVAVGQPRRLVTKLADLSAVDWSGENKLIIAGYEGRPAIYETGVDGAEESPRKQDIGARVTHLSAYAADSVGPLPTGAYMYEANKVAYQSNPFDTIKRDQVLNVTAPAAGVRASNPTAPFFLY
ncbi:Sporulation and spore germination [Micromonospora rhizosphaerae]|uniref:Sporulation and spore germination n=1 Tax=Micromonospora rhizosphaerae TaxID=568872 RepID=A0A1C6RRL4_9ACTN|nr:LpqB family beta-propeller domain-containing protein [Micromonospora rhizosphaerae]SCL19827.1 Sporulation and spore germination [Micromonospora rhizosphaerae]